MKSHSPKIEYNEMVVSEKLQNFSEKNREETLEKIRKIMMESAMAQVVDEDVYNSFANDSGDKYEEKNDVFFDL